MSKLIDMLVNDKVYKSISRNVCKNNDLLDDLHSEAILVIIEKGYKLEDIENVKHFFATVVKLTWLSNKFRKKYFTTECILNENFDLVDATGEINYNVLFDSISHDYKTDTEMYEKNLMRLYVEHGDCRKIHELTKIPYRTVANDIREIKLKLKKQHNELNYDKNPY